MIAVRKGPQLHFGAMIKHRELSSWRSVGFRVVDGCDELYRSGPIVAATSVVAHETARESVAVASLCSTCILSHVLRNESSATEPAHEGKLQIWSYPAPAATVDPRGALHLSELTICKTRAAIWEAQTCGEGKSHIGGTARLSAELDLAIPMRSV